MIRHGGLGRERRLGAAGHDRQGAHRHGDRHCGGVPRDADAAIADGVLDLRQAGLREQGRKGADKFAVDRQFLVLGHA